MDRKTQASRAATPWRLKQENHFPNRSHLQKGVKKDHTGLTSPENDVPLGTGELDIPAILREAKKIGIRHYFIEDESSQVNTQVPQSIAYLKSLKE